MIQAHNCVTQFVGGVNPFAAAAEFMAHPKRVVRTHWGGKPIVTKPAIMDFLKTQTQPVSAFEVFEALGGSRDGVALTLSKMAIAGMIKRTYVPQHRTIPSPRYALWDAKP